MRFNILGNMIGEGNLNPCPTSYNTTILPLMRQFMQPNRPLKYGFFMVYRIRGPFNYIYVFISCSELLASSVTTAQMEDQVDFEVAEGYTITQFCDKIINVFLYEKPKTKDWRKYLVFREEWNKYRDRFYNRCQTRADSEDDPQMKQNLIALARKVKKVSVFKCNSCSYICLCTLNLVMKIGMFLG